MFTTAGTAPSQVTTQADVSRLSRTLSYHSGGGAVTGGRTQKEVPAAVGPLPFLEHKLNLVHPAAEALHESPALRSLLGVKEFTPRHLVNMAKVVPACTTSSLMNGSDPVKPVFASYPFLWPHHGNLDMHLQDVCHQGKQNEMKLAWIAQLLVCIFEEALIIPPELSEHPPLSLATAHTVRSSVKATLALDHGAVRAWDHEAMRALRQLPLLPLLTGDFTSAAGNSQVAAAPGGRPYDAGPIFLPPNCFNYLRQNEVLADGQHVREGEVLLSSSQMQQELPKLLTLVMGVDATRELATRMRFLDPAILSTSISQSLKAGKGNGSNVCAPQSILLFGLKVSSSKPLMQAPH
jgi:hypothetical protein